MLDSLRDSRVFDTRAKATQSTWKVLGGALYNVEDPINETSRHGAMEKVAHAVNENTTGRAPMQWSTDSTSNAIARKSGLDIEDVIHALMGYV